MNKVDNENMYMIPLDQCGMTFNELNDQCWKSFLKKEVKHFVKIEKEWMQRTIFEKQNALEVSCHWCSFNLNDNYIQLNDLSIINL